MRSRAISARCEVPTALGSAHISRNSCGNMRVGPSFAFWKFPWKYDPPGGFKSCQLHETGKFPGNLTSLGDFPAPERFLVVWSSLGTGLEWIWSGFGTLWRVGSGLEWFWSGFGQFWTGLEGFWSSRDITRDSGEGRKVWKSHVFPEISLEICPFFREMVSRNKTHSLKNYVPRARRAQSADAQF